MNKILLVLLTCFIAPQAIAAEAYATFAGGCFWCTESDFEKLPGVLDAVSGYTGGKVVNPTYEQVSSGATGHVEAVQVHYDPAIVSYSKLLDYFWHHHDPLNGQGQFCDIGEQYRPVIFVANEAERDAATKSKAAQAKRFKQPIATEILPATTFYPAEQYHQDYYKKNAFHYRYYRLSCGRDARIDVLNKR